MDQHCSSPGQRADPLEQEEVCANVLLAPGFPLLQRTPSRAARRTEHGGAQWGGTAAAVQCKEGTLTGDVDFCGTDSTYRLKEFELGPEYVIFFIADICKI